MSEMGMTVFRLEDGTYHCQFETHLPLMGVLRVMWVTQAAARTGATTVLDLAGGNGEMSRFISKWAKVTVLDCDAKNEEAAMKVGVQKFIHARLQDSPSLFSEKFGAILLCEILEHAKDKEEASEWVKIAASLGEYVIITTPYERGWHSSAHPFTNPEHLLYWTDTSLLFAIGEADVQILFWDRISWLGYSYYFIVVSANKKSGYDFFSSSDVRAVLV